MTRIKIWCLYGLAIIIVASLILALKPVHIIQPTGIVLPLTKARAPLSSESVQFLQTLPNSYQRLAFINVELHSPKQSNKLVKEIGNYAKLLAARQGANGLVVTEFGFEPPSVSNPAPLAMYVFHGEAIYSNNRD